MLIFILMIRGDIGIGWRNGTIPYPKADPL